MSNPVAFPFHATVKWPAVAGGPDLMVNVYAESADQLAARYEEAMRYFAPQLAAFRAEAPAAPQIAPARSRQPEPVNVAEEVANVSCMHGSSEWIESSYGGWYIRECRCALTPDGELKQSRKHNPNNAAIHRSGPPARFAGNRR